MQRVARAVDARTCKQANLRLFNDTLNRVLKSLPNRDQEELFTVEFRGHKFNALPFILNGACYCDNTVFKWLLNAIAQDCPVQKDISIQEIAKNKLTGAKVLESLLPGAPGKREIWAFYYTRNPATCSRLLFQAASRILNLVVLFGEYRHIEYKYTDICNTQAFCYYMLAYWLVNITPVLRRQIESNLKKSGFIQVFESLCPENSIHFQFIKGEISEDKLAQVYDTPLFEDDSTILIREAYSNMSKGNYDGSLMSKEKWSIGREEADARFQYAEYYLNMHIAEAYLFHGTYDSMLRDIDRAKSAQQASLDAEERAKQRYSKSADECRALRIKNRELQDQVKQLQLEISRHSTDDKLHKRIAELEKDLSVVRGENAQLFDELLGLKQELSHRAKQIKQLSARVPDDVIEEVNTGVVVEDVPIETMIEALKDRRIVMVGGDRSKTLVKTFEDWGFRYFSNVSGNVRRIDCEFLVVCSVLVSHGDVYQAEKAMRGQNAELVYVNGVNAELILKALYEASLEG